MGYERNDRRPGSYSGERGGYGGGYDRDRSRDEWRGGPSYGSYGGAGARDYRGDRFNDDGRREYGRDPRGSAEDRGFFDRAGDEVRSWFGDEDAERRRRDDERRYQAENRYGERGAGEWSSRGGSDRDHGNQGYGGSSYGGGQAYGSGQSYGAQSSGGRTYGSQDYGNQNYGERSYAGYQGPRGSDRSSDREQGGHHDSSYRSWRDRQMQSFDQDYDDYRRENQSRFDQEFHSWRQGRQGQRDLLAKVKEHAEVVGSDGQHVGTVDHVRDGQIKLTKSDEAAGGHHHLIPASWIQSVDDKVTLTKTADQAKQHWRDAEQSGSGGGLFGRDQGSAQSGTHTFDRAFGETDKQR